MDSISKSRKSSPINIFLVLSLTASHASHPVQLIFPAKEDSNASWTAAELQLEIAVKPLYRSKEASTHLIRLKGKEKPHFHDHHDLSVSVLSGKSVIHFKDREVTMMPGDVVFIPQGILHWAENIDPSASVVFAVFSPAFSGKDNRSAE